MSAPCDWRGGAAGALLLFAVAVLCGGAPRAASAGEDDVARWKQVARRALALQQGGQFSEADQAYIEALDIAEKAKLAPLYLEFSLVGRNRCLEPQSAWVALRDVNRRLLQVRETLGDEKWILESLITVGYLERAAGNYVVAHAVLRRAVRLAEARDDPIALAAASSRLADLLLAMGRLAKARRAAETAERLYSEAEDARGLLETWQVLGALQSALGHPRQARAFYERALLGAGGMPLAFRSRLLLSLGEVHAEIGDGKKALARVQEARDLNAKAGDAIAAVGAGIVVGKIHEDQERWRDALATYEGVKEAAMDLPLEAARASLGIAEARRRLGELGQARKGLDDVVALGATLIAPALELEANLGLARIELAQGNPAQAAVHAGRAMAVTTSLTEGLAPTAHAFARQGVEDLFSVAIEVAFAQSEIEATHALLDRTRARTLSRALGVRGSLSTLPLDAPAREDLARAAAHLKEERDRLAAARRTTSRKLRREAWVAFQRARDEYRRRLESVQQEELARLKLDDTRLRSLAEVQKALPAGAALVLYAFAGERLRALVVEPGGARVPDLGPADEVRADVEHLLELIEDVSARGEDRTGIIESEAKKLRARLLGPLKLRAGVGTLLVSPDGELGRLPFSLLAPELEVAMVPSASFVAGGNGETRARGKGTLAVGDPKYGDPKSAGALGTPLDGADLRPLPASRSEVEAVTGPGDVPLLGADATEANFLRHLATRPRWRSVLFTCHGLLDANRPEWSALALTPTEDSDGLLTVAEILGMQVHADVAVLSACDTALGKNVRGEGLFSLASAFLHAGAPRVIASLWKVDDAATEALMVKFYELWAPAKGGGLGAAKALKQAQAHVKDHKKWRHPYYWSAWVLWGLPD